MVGPLSTGMSQCATAPCRVSTGDVRCRCAGIFGQLFGGNEAEVIVAMWNLLCPTGIDDIDLRGDLISRAKPRLADNGKRIVGVIVGEHLRGMQCELLRGVPDPVVGAGLTEVVAVRIACLTLRVDDREERLAGPVHHVGEKAPSKITTPGPSASARISSDCSARRSVAPIVAAVYTSTLLRTAVASG